MGRYNYTRAFEGLLDFAVKAGFDVIYDHHDISEIRWENMTLNSPSVIKIEANYPIEIKVYLFLHELGHHMLRKDWEKFKKVLPILAHAEQEHTFNYDDRYKRRVIYDVACMEEEFKAWDEGYKLGSRLGIRINDRKWFEFKSKCLLEYMRYYSIKKH